MTPPPASAPSEALTRAPPLRGIRKGEEPGYALAADLQDCEDVDPDHVEIVDDVDSFVRHGVVASTRTTDDARHSRHPIEVGGIGAVEAGRRDGAGWLLLAAHLLVSGIDRLDDRVVGRDLERRHRHATRCRLYAHRRLEAGMTALQRVELRPQVRQGALFRLPRRIASGALDLDVIGDLGRPPLVQLLAEGAVHDADMDAVDLLVFG